MIFDKSFSPPLALESFFHKIEKALRIKFSDSRFGEKPAMRLQ